MRRILVYVILTLILLPSCSKSGSSTKVVKPKYHHRWYDRKKDKKTKRTKTIKVR